MNIIKENYFSPFCNEQLFDLEALQKLNLLASNIHYKDAMVNFCLIGNIQIPILRKAQISWIDNNSSTAWIFTKLQLFISNCKNNLLIDENALLFNRLQFCVYRQTCHHFWHRDGNNAYNRYALLSIQLSDEGEYEGGDLLVKSKNGLYTASKKPGSITVFYANDLHSVRKIRLGERRCIVTWCSVKR